MEFLEGDSTFFNFPKTHAGDSRPPEPLKTNPPSACIPYPRLSFNFGGNMEANKPWLVVDVIVIPGAQHHLPKHLEKLLPKFDPDNDVLSEDHIKKFMLSLRLMNVEDEDVVCRLFPYTF